MAIRALFLPHKFYSQYSFIYYTIKIRHTMNTCVANSRYDMAPYRRKSIISFTILFLLIELVKKEILQFPNSPCHVLRHAPSSGFSVIFLNFSYRSKIPHVVTEGKKNPYISISQWTSHTFWQRSCVSYLWHISDVSFLTQLLKIYRKTFIHCC